MIANAVLGYDDIGFQTFCGSAVPFPRLAIAVACIPVDENFTMPFRRDQLEKEIFSAPPEEPIGGSAGTNIVPKKTGTVMSGIVSPMTFFMPPTLLGTVPTKASTVLKIDTKKIGIGNRQDKSTGRTNFPGGVAHVAPGTDVFTKKSCFAFVALVLSDRAL